MLLYDSLAPILEAKLYPSLKPVFNVYEGRSAKARMRKRFIRRLVGFHTLREIDDSGYIDNLYKNHRGCSELTLRQPRTDEAGVASWGCGHVVTV